MASDSVIIGACKITIHIPQSRSLKDKRQVVKSIIAKVRNQFDVAVAEVDGLGRWQVASLGIACVSNSGMHAQEVLERVVDFIQQSRLDAEVTEYRIELLKALE